MKDNITRPEVLANKLFNKNITPEEELGLNSWYIQHLDEQVEIPADFVASEEAHRIRMLDAIRQQRTQSRNLRLWPRFAGMAAAVCLILLSIYFLSDYRRADVMPLPSYASDIAPGTNGATLTLANGKKIKLSDIENGELANEAGVKITKSDDGQLLYEIVGQVGNQGAKSNTLSTANGETYQVRLPDGSVVYLNAASSLIYPSTFTSLKDRRVKLQGEAYFEIAKDKAHPFVVESKGQEVAVLGTHFNVNSYDDEPTTKTTLVEGSIKIKAGEHAEILKPNQQSILSRGTINVTEANVKEEIAWKEGDFVFKNENVTSVMRKLARWYNIEVVYEGALPEDTFEGEISRYRNISQVLSVLEQTKGIHFKIEGRKVIVSK